MQRLTVEASLEILNRVTVCHQFSVRGKYSYSSLLFKDQIFQFLFFEQVIILTCTPCKHVSDIFKSAITLSLSCGLKYRISLVRYFLLSYVQWQLYLKNILIIFNQFSGDYCLSYFTVWNYWWLYSSHILILQIYAWFSVPDINPGF